MVGDPAWDVHLPNVDLCFRGFVYFSLQHEHIYAVWEQTKYPWLKMDS